MRRAPRRRHWLAVGSMASVLLHGAIGVLIVGLPARPPWSDDDVAAPEQNPFEHQERTPLGISRSKAVTITWIGFEQPTEHEAPEADTEQAAFSRFPMGDPIQDPALARADTPAPADAAQPETSPEVEPEKAPHVVDEALARQLTRTPDLAMPPPAQEPGPPETQTTPEDTAPAEESEPDPAETPASDSAQPADDADDAVSEDARPAGADEMPGEPSDRESEATALDEPIDVRPGRPAAREGLEIRTTRPRWRTTTLLTASPRNPVVVVEFRRNGTVARADFVREGRMVHNTGHRDVDGPLLDAIYRWRAEGEALQALDPDDPDAVFRVTIRVQLR